MAKIKYQTKSITLANGLATMQEDKVTLEKDFDRCVGYTVYRKGGPTNWLLGIKDSTGIHVDRTYSDDHIHSTTVPHAQRFKEIDLRAGGNIVTIQTEPEAALGSELTVDVIFKLVRNEKDCDTKPQGENEFKEFFSFLKGLFEKNKKEVGNI